MKHLFLSLALSLFALPALAVNPDEVLADPVLEERARGISAGLRCVVCRGENIDESNAEIARDLRILVRERLLVGESDAEIIDFVVDRYGEFVLMKPNTQGANVLLWATGPLLFLIAAISAGFYLRRRARTGEGKEALSQAEEDRLNELLKD